MQKNLIFLLILGIHLSCNNDSTQQPPGKNTDTEIEMFESIISNPDFQLAFNKFLKDPPSSRKVQRIEFWLDTLINQHAISNTDLDALHQQAGTLRELQAEKFRRKQFLMDSLLQNTISNGGQATAETIADWENEINTQLGITQEDLDKQSQHQEHTQSLATAVQDERAAKERLIAQYPQLQDERYLAKVIEYYDQR